MNIKAFVKNNKKYVVKIFTILLISIGLVAMIIGNPVIMKFLSSPDQIKDYIESKGPIGIFIYIALQIVQIVIAIIPGEPIQLAGGYIYGGFYGFILSTVGIMMGSVMAFYLSKKYGFSMVSKLVPKQKLISYKEKLESRKGSMLLFVLCLIPGVPKDVLVYAVGLTPMKFKIFFPIYFFARIPAMLIASYLGAQIGRVNIEQIMLTIAILTVFAVLFYLFRNKLYFILDIEK